MPTLQVNAPYANRIVLLCAPLVGPFTSPVLGDFDPRRDMSFYVDGDPITITNFSFDANNNRYLMYASAPFNLQGVIQAVHHMPNPPFQTSSNPPVEGQEFGQNPDIGGGQ